MKVEKPMSMAEFMRSQGFGKEHWEGESDDYLYEEGARPRADHAHRVMLEGVLRGAIVTLWAYRTGLQGRFNVSGREYTRGKASSDGVFRMAKNDAAECGCWNPRYDNHYKAASAGKLNYAALRRIRLH